MSYRSGSGSPKTGTQQGIDGAIPSPRWSYGRRDRSLVLGATGRGFSFGPFRLHPEQRLLLEDGRRVPLGSRCLDVLILLVEAAGEVVDKDELLKRVWVGMTVDAGSLRVTMSALRKVLHDPRTEARYILNVAGRGYRFVAPVLPTEDLAANPKVLASPRKAIGRDDFIVSVAAQIPTRRLVTIVGPGGVGKTTVALEVAKDVAGLYRDGTHLADLSSLSGPHLVPSALASLLGVGVYSEDPLPGLRSFLTRRQVLLVFDNCEHVVGAVAALAEDLLAASPSLHILATSREPLRAAGEWVRRLGPLGSPPEGPMTLEQVMAFPAVHLFVERATASLADFAPADQDSGVIGEICRGLDGIPLAIELAAARVAELGLQGVAVRLGDRFSLLSKGRRTAASRQRTLRDTLEWSHKLLSPDEQTVLARLSVFAATFSMSSALTVGSFGRIGDSAMVDALVNLVAKSLLVAEPREREVRYRLLDMTRDYARSKLDGSGEHDEVARRHAAESLSFFQDGKADWDLVSGDQWLRHYSSLLGDVRSALDWAFSPSGDSALGVELTTASSPLWAQLAFMSEHRTLIERALRVNAAASRPDPLMEMRLNAALGNILFHTTQPSEDAATAAVFYRCLDASIALGDAGGLRRALSGLCAVRTARGRYAEAVAFAEQLQAAPGGSGSQAAMRSLAHTLHYFGDLERSQHYLGAAWDAPSDGGHARGSGVYFDHKVTITLVQAKNLWLMGFPDQSLAAARQCVEDARANASPVSLCLALGSAVCPLMFMTAGSDAAQPFVDLLQETYDRHSMTRWKSWVDAFHLVMLPRRDREERGLTRSFEQLVESIEGPLLENLAALGDDHTDELLVTRAASGTGGWCAPEILRAQGAAALRRDGDLSKAAETFRAALDLARRKGMPAWELRAATSLADALRDGPRRREGREILAKAYAAFTEGHQSVDHRRAKVLIDELC